MYLVSSRLRRFWKGVAPLVALALGTGNALAQAPDVPTVPAPQQQSAASSGKIVLPERTEVKLTLKEDLKSGSNQVGEEVPFEVENDVYGPNHVLLIPAGTAAYGKVTQSSRRGMFGKAGKLNFTCDYILTPDGIHVPLRSDPLTKEGGSNQGAAIATVLLFSVAGVFINGKDVTVKKGTDFAMYVNENTAVTPPFNAPVPPVAPAPAPVAAATPGKSLFTLKDGNQIAGTMTRFDGKTYTISTDNGVKKIAAVKVKSIYALK